MTLPSAILSTTNLLNNFKVIKTRAPKSQVMAMLKANGYGHGIRSTALRLEGIADYLAVARLDEALALRKVGIKNKLVIMQGVNNQEDFLAAFNYSFELVLHDFYQLELLTSLNYTLNNQINLWLKIDTGLGRLGFKPEELNFVYQKLSSLKFVGEIILFSHLALSEEISHPINEKQKKIFASLAQDFPGKKSLANSGAIFNFPDSHYDIVRPGLALYGYSPIKEISSKELGLKPVMSLVASIISIRNLPKNSTIGYGSLFTTERDSKIATVAIGYGDGYPRTAKSGTPFLIKGVFCPLVGRVSMDMITIDITDLKEEVKVGDFVTCWSENLPLEVVFPFTSNIIYDILTSMQLRVKFFWR
jgi:alanine racemase